MSFGDGAIDARGETKIVGIDDEAAQAPTVNDEAAGTSGRKKPPKLGGLCRRSFSFSRLGVAKEQLDFLEQLREQFGFGQTGGDVVTL